MKIERKLFTEKIEVVDSQGTKHTVIIFSPLIEIPPSNIGLDRYRDHRKIDALRIELSDKRPVNRIDDNTFEIVTTGEILKRVK